MKNSGGSLTRIYMPMILLLFIVLAGFCLPVSAHATLFTYDFATIAQGSYEGTTLNEMTLSSEAGTLKNVRICATIIGLSGNDPWMAGAASDIYMTFSTPINYFSITAGDPGGDFDRFEISLYEFGTDTLITTLATPIFNGSSDPSTWLYTLDYSGTNIGKVVFDPGNSESLPGVISSGGGQIMTGIAYDDGSAPVPEPATMILLGSGLLGLAGFRRKIK